MTSVVLPVPHIQQRQRGECLAACAEMVLTYLGFSVAYEHLLKLLEITSRIGTPAYNIRKLEKLHVSVIYQQGSLADLHRHLLHEQPCIAFVKTQELPYWREAVDHAVVVVGMDDQSVYLNDPALTEAPLQVSCGDFDLAWLERDEFYTTFIKQE